VLEVPREAVEPWLEGHRDQLDSLSHALVEAETLDANDAYTAAGTPDRACVRCGSRPLRDTRHFTLLYLT
jgi:hypothetical protein